MDKAQVEKALEEMPKTASDSLRAWRTADKKKKQVEARIFLSFKEKKSPTGKILSDENAWMQVYLDSEWGKAVDETSDAEAAFYLNDETLKSVKKLSDIRSAY